MKMEALHCGLRVQDELQNIAVNFFLFNKHFRMLIII